MDARAVELVGGVVAHNEARTVGPAIHSLIDQELPAGVAWRAIWVVVSGCTDGTEAVVREAARGDPRIRLVEERERRGKGLALNAIFDRAEGALLVLLNGDAIAPPGSVRALLAAASTTRPPFAVMATPEPPPPHRAGGTLEAAVGLLWEIHEEVHRATLGARRGNHLSDELLLLSLPVHERFPPDTINDGAYLGASLLRRGGRLRLAEGARVRIQVPTTVREYLTQRRRIYVGHARIARRSGTMPTTFVSFALRDPRGAVRVVRRATPDRSTRRAFSLLLALEVLAVLLAAWDALPPRPDHARWRRIRAPSSWKRGTARESPRT